MVQIELKETINEKGFRQRNFDPSHPHSLPNSWKLSIQKTSSILLVYHEP